MPRKFISFLGAIPYKEARYYFDPDRRVMASPTPYVQRAIFEAGIPKWDATADEVLIFTTPEALTNNYLNRILRFDREKSEPVLEKGAGLESVLRQLQKEGAIGAYRAVDIPNGNTEAEIWKVFQEIFDQLSAGDEVYFDITYGFRSLPMLGIVLLNYARALRDIQIQAIFYGNYEAGRAEGQEKVKAEKKKKSAENTPADDEPVVEAPVINLMPFAELQEWTYAARTFLDSGNAGPLAAIAGDQNANLSRELLRFSQALMTCRGKALVEDLNIDLLQRIVSLGQQLDIEEQLKPLLREIEKKIRPFRSNSLHNGFAAVDWCIQHGMVQQGITFLQETLVSYVVEHCSGRDHLHTLFYRLAAGSALNGFKNLPDTIIRKKEKLGIDLANNEMQNICRQMFRFVKSKDKLMKFYKKLTGSMGFRNDINHCGFRHDYKSPEELTTDLKDLFRKIKRLNL